MNNRLKQIIFDKLYQDLKHLEIIPYGNSVWFIDRKEKYWYLEYKKSGKLWWRWEFFSKFFVLFSMERNEYEPIISEWVEEVLNFKVETTLIGIRQKTFQVEEVLNFKVETTRLGSELSPIMVEVVLNCKVKTTLANNRLPLLWVEEVLNSKVETTVIADHIRAIGVEGVLSYKVKTPTGVGFQKHLMVEKVLNHKDN